MLNLDDNNYHQERTCQTVEARKRTSTNIQEHICTFTMNLTDTSPLLHGSGMGKHIQ